MSGRKHSFLRLPSQQSIDEDATVDTITTGKERSVEAGEFEDAAQPSEKLWGTTRRKLILVSLCLVYFGSCASFSVLSPFFPGEGKAKKASGTVVGIIFGVYSLVTFIVSPFMGVWLPKVGPRFMITGGLLLLGGGETLFGFVGDMPDGTIFIVFCIILRIVAAFGGSMADVAIFAIVAGEYPKNLGVVMGFMEVFSGLGFMVGPPIGGILYTTGGFKLPFLVMGGLILLTLPLVMFVLPMPKEVTGEEEEKGSLTAVLKIPAILMLGSCIVLSGIVLGFLDPTLSPHLKTFGLNPAQIGLMFLLMGASYGISAPVVGWIGDKTGKTRVLIVIGVLLACLGYLTLGPSPLVPFLPKKKVWVAVISLIMLGLSISCYLVPCMPDMMETVKRNGLPDDITTHGVISGIFGSLMSIGAFLGPTIGGAMNHYLQFGWSVTVLAGVLAFQGMLLAVFSVVEAGRLRPSHGGQNVNVNGFEEFHNQEDPHEV